MAYMRQIGALVEPIAIENLFLRDNSFLTSAGVKVNYMSQGMSIDVFSKSDLLFPLVNEKKKNEKGEKKTLKTEPDNAKLKKEKSAIFQLKHYRKQRQLSAASYVLKQIDIEDG